MLMTTQIFSVLNTGTVVGISACIVCICQCVFLVYCFAPVSSNGSLTLYNKVIRPFILKHQKKIDETLGKAAGAAQTALNEGCFSAFLDCFLRSHLFSMIVKTCTVERLRLLGQNVSVLSAIVIY